MRKRTESDFGFGIVHPYARDMCDSKVGWALAHAGSFCGRDGATECGKDRDATLDSESSMWIGVTRVTTTNESAWAKAHPTNPLGSF
jgi:hypothetical protein